MPEPVLFIAGFLIVTALLFDFINGFHDAANAIATVVATNVLKPRQAVLLAAFWNFMGMFFFGVAVATTIGKGIISPEFTTLHVLFAGLIGAIIWDLITWYWGLPTSSSHALIGGFVGAAIAVGGFKVIIWSGLTKILIFIFLAPLIGFIGAILVSILTMHLFRKSTPSHVNSLFRKLQLVSSSLYSLGHGTNDAQKTMGVIAIILFSAGLTKQFHVPIWVIFASHASIALGTYFGGWRIIKTMGHKITKLRPIDGFAAEGAGSIVLLGTATAGIPVSTTHVISGSIMGVGSTRRVSAVRWIIARKIVLTWIVTIPIAALFGAALSRVLLILF